MGDKTWQDRATKARQDTRSKTGCGQNPGKRSQNIWINIVDYRTLIITLNITYKWVQTNDLIKGQNSKHVTRKGSNQ